MTSELLARLEHEIEMLRARHAAFIREFPAARELPARWTLARETLCWLVPFDVEDEVLEPDIDVEISQECLIVRAHPQSDERLLLLSLLPVPSSFDIEHPLIRYEEGFLEVRLRTTRGAR